MDIRECIAERREQIWERIAERSEQIGEHIAGRWEPGNMERSNNE